MAIDAAGVLSAPRAESDPLRWSEPPVRCESAPPVAVSPDGGWCVAATEGEVAVFPAGGPAVVRTVAQLAERSGRTLVAVRPQAVAVADGGATAALVADVTWQTDTGFENDHLGWISLATCRAPQAAYSSFSSPHSSAPAFVIQSSEAELPLLMHSWSTLSIAFVSAPLHAGPRPSLSSPMFSFQAKSFSNGSFLAFTKVIAMSKWLSR